MPSENAHAPTVTGSGDRTGSGEGTPVVTGQYARFSGRARSLLGGSIRIGLIASGFVLLLAIGVRDRLLLSSFLVFFGMACLALLLIARNLLPVHRLYFLLTLDVLIISMTAWALGAQTSSLRYGYVIIVVGYTLQRNPRIGLASLLFSLVGYLAVLLLDEAGAIPRAPLAASVTEPHTVLGGIVHAYLFPALVLIAAYVFLAFVVKRLEMHMEEERRLRASEKEAQERNLSMQARLNEAQRLESLGRLAGGVAHDFNNLLTAILGYSECVRLDLAPDHPSAPDLEAITEAALRASKLTSELLAFSRKQIVEIKAVDLNRIVQDALQVIHRIIGEDIEIRVSLGDDLQVVEGDPSQLHQVLLNLAINARDAMPEGGVLAIETANRSVTQAERTLTPEVPCGDYVVLTVQDNGIGMDAQTLGHIFEPFFTTKEKGKGTGLGLATVYGIIKQLQGGITAESQPGQGSRFYVFLPRAERGLTTEAPPSVPPLGGNETVLLVEDESSVRDLARRYLEGMGYRVLVAGNGEEALRIAAEFASDIQLLLTDVVLPGFSGKVLAERLVAIQPDASVLYMSGYTDNVIAQRGILDPDTALIQKPFSRRDLLIKVREVLAHRLQNQDREESG